MPTEWAATQTNLAGARWALGQRRTGTKELREAVSTYHEALVVFTRDRAPLDWANTQYNLGTALITIGEREKGTESLEQAIIAFRAALEVLTPERNPFSRAQALDSLGYGLRILYKREAAKPIAAILEAIHLNEQALNTFDHLGDTHNAHIAAGNLVLAALEFENSRASLTR